MGDIAQWYVCQDCGQVGPMADFQGECRPGWTHGRLGKIEMASPALRNVRGAVERAKETEELLGLALSYVDGPVGSRKFELRQRIRRHLGGRYESRRRDSG